MSIANRLKSNRISSKSNLLSIELQAEMTNLSKAIKSLKENKEKQLTDTFINRLEIKKRIAENKDSILNISFGHIDPSLLPKPITQSKKLQNNNANGNIVINHSIKKSQSGYDIQEIKTKKYIQKRELSLHSRKNSLRNSKEKTLSNKPSFHNKITDILAKKYRENPKSHKLIYIPSVSDSSDNSSINPHKLTRNKYKYHKMLQDDIGANIFNNNKSNNRTSIPTPTRQMRMDSNNEDLHIQTWVNNTLNWQKSVDKKREKKRRENEEKQFTEEKGYFYPNTALSKHNSMSYLHNSKSNLPMRRSNSMTIHNRLYNYNMYIQSNIDQLVKKNTPSFTPTLYHPKKSNANKKKEMKHPPIKTPPQVCSYTQIKQKQMDSKQKREHNLLQIKKPMRNSNNATNQQKENEIALKNKALTKKTSVEYIKTILDELYDDNKNVKKRQKFIPCEELYRLNIRTTLSSEIERNTLLAPKAFGFLENTIL